MSEKINRLILEKVFNKETKYSTFKFSENMTAAWMIVAKTTAEPFAWNFEAEYFKSGKILYHASIWGDWDGKLKSWDAREVSMPLAICKAVLKWAEATRDE